MENKIPVDQIKIGVFLMGRGTRIHCTPKKKKEPDEYIESCNNICGLTIPVVIAQKKNNSCSILAQKKNNSCSTLFSQKYII